MIEQGRILEDEEFVVGGLAPSFMPETGYEYIAGVSGWPRPITPGLLGGSTYESLPSQYPPQFGMPPNYDAAPEDPVYGAPVDAPPTLASIPFPVEPYKPFPSLPPRSVRLSPTSPTFLDYFDPTADPDPELARFNFEKGGYGFLSAPDTDMGREVRLANQGLFVDDAARAYLELGGPDWWADAQATPKYSPIDLDVASGSYRFPDLETDSKYYDPVTDDWTKTWEEVAQESAAQYAKDMATYDREYAEYLEDLSAYTNYLQSLGYSTYEDLSSNSDNFGPAELTPLPVGYGLVPRSVDPIYDIVEGGIVDAGPVMETPIGIGQTPTGPIYGIVEGGIVDAGPVMETPYG